MDRIGGKTFRGGELDVPEEACFLKVSVPFLVGTYDERMFEELCRRAQMLEVLTGGVVSSTTSVPGTMRARSTKSDFWRCPSAGWRSFGAGYMSGRTPLSALSTKVASGGDG
jgi:hypothetical protein